MTTVAFASRTTVVAPQASTIRILLQLNPPSAAELVVPMAHSGTATYGTDWALPATVRIPAGKASWSFSVTLKAGFVTPETAVLQAQPGNGYTVATDKATHTIARAIVSPIGEKPDATNTGPKGALTAYTGPSEIIKAGTVLQNVLISGGLRIRAPNVAVRNFKLDGKGTLYGIECNTYDAPGLVIEDGEVVNCASVGVYGLGFVARRLNVHEQGGDAFKHHGQGSIEACWIHHLGKAAGAHADGDQSLTGAGIVIRGNNIDVPQGLPGYEGNSALSFSGVFHECRDVLIEENWLNGGTYTVYLTEDQYGLTNCRFLKNRFGRGFQYGPFYNDTDAVIAGNVWDDTGELMNINNTP
jgi:hypothetical protein